MNYVKPLVQAMDDQTGACYCSVYIPPSRCDIYVYAFGHYVCVH